MAKKKIVPDTALTLFDVPATKVVYAEPKRVKESDLVRSLTVDVSSMGLVAITEGRSETFKTLADTFGNKLR